MKFVCAKSVFQGREAFSTLGDTLVLADGAINADDVVCADGLIIRSKTEVNQGLVDGSRLRFVGTATAGTDHLDLEWLGKRGIVSTSAPGCNANSVAEYVITALLVVADRYQMNLRDMTIGIIGVGHVGSLLAEKCRLLGMNVMLNDPPRHDATRDCAFQPLEDLLTHANVISLHVPLTREGRYPTYHLADCRFFAALKQGTLFLNTSRGAVVESEALQMALERGQVTRCILDVWEAEPAPERELLRRAELITPHIAGYSLDGKLRGTEMIYQQACHFFEVECTWQPEHLPQPEPPLITLDARGLSRQEALCRIVRRACDIERDDRLLREALELDDAAAAERFVQLRAGYPVRREFAAFSVQLENAPDALREQVSGLGFQMV